MKKLLLSAALVALGFSASAQDVKPLRLQLNIGTNYSTGDFSATDMTSESSGYAKNGAHFSIGLMKELNPNFGIGITLAGKTNALNTESMERQIKEFGGSAKVEGDGYSSGYLMGDFYGLLPLNNTTLYAKASLGYGSLTMSEMKMTISDGEDTYNIQRKELTASSAVYGLAGGFRHDFGKFGLGLEVAYMSGTAKFEDDGESYEQPYGTISSTIGIHYRIK
ncbi:outer membrane beta-barrel protein [Pontibacter sp. Tf4]|uniref:outer membrane beta-barrel protein n=1 Tax=Pontibacter sp. Tf4 TaxID=2761620 RepID=UPI001626C6E3|nr:outer membrane beta-barrel protein [Pontibacter sp. Tf4]MBB6612884.1 outer membrane beta-barrel protein [Pontibacter sp. Tf4]